MTTGSVEPLKKLYERFGGEVHFLDILIRQAHPGPGVRAYRSFADKLEDARRYQDAEGIPWPVLVDGLDGAVHQVYGGVADPTYLLDAAGRVSFYNVWTSAPVLHRAIDALLAQKGRGVVCGGIDRLPHGAASLTDGWRALQRGLPQSFTDLMVAAPGLPLALWLGAQLRPLLKPVTLRAKPASPALRIAIGVSAVALAALLLARGRRRAAPI